MTTAISESVIRIGTLDDIRGIEAEPIESVGLPTSTYDILRQSAERFGDRIALRYLPTASRDEMPVDFSYSHLLERVNQAANAFHALGVAPGDSVSMLLPSLPQAFVAFLGAEAAGIFNPINPMLEVEHIAAIVREADTRVLVTTAPGENGLWQKAQAVKALVPGLQHILTVNPGGGKANGESVDFDTLLDAQNAASLDSQRQFAPGDIASYFHTGGTTGVPKLAPHSHFNEVASAYQLIRALDLDEHAVGLCGLPLFHVNGVFVTGLAPWLAGGQVVLATASGYRTPLLIENFWALVEKYRVTYLSVVPTIVGALLERPMEGYDLTSLEVALSGGAALPTEVIRRFEAGTGLALVEGYGQTEGSSASTVNPRYGERRLGSVGLPLPWCRVRVVEVGSDGRWVRDCDVDEAGVVAISGPNVFAGYKQPSQNTGQWVAEGWFNTGDLGRLDADGYLWLTGRSKDVIIRGGHNIDPQMIEEAYYRHDAVAEAVAIGKPDRRVGELPILVVQLRPGVEVSAEELLEYGAQHIHERAAVPKEVHFVDAMPLTAVAKIYKPALRDQLVRAQVEGELHDALGLDCDVSVEADKRYGQRVCVRVPDQGDEAAVRELLGDYSFHLEIQ